MKVLTHEGFKTFKSISNNGLSDKLLLVSFSDNETLKCTHDHEFLMDDGITFIPIVFLCVGDVLFNDKVIISIEQIPNEIVYDLVNVEDINSYYTNGIVSHNCVALDEFGFVHDAETFFTSTFPVVTSGANTKVIITSTPNGVGNTFHRIWQQAVSRVNEFSPLRIDWWDVPGRDEEWKRKTISNTSELQFSQEYSCEFIGSSNTLLSTEALLSLKAIEPKCILNGVRYYETPIEFRKYIMTVDVSRGRGQDYSTFNVTDVTVSPFIQVAVYRDNNISPLLFPDVIVRTAKQYNEALVIIENNDAGHLVCSAVYHEYEYENTFVESAVKAMGIGCSMTKRVKRIGCSNIKDIIESNKLVINDTDTIQELATFESNGTSFEASGGNHDDLVMNLVMFGWFASTDMFKDLSSVDLKDLLFSERIKAMEDDVVPFGFMSGELDNDVDMSKYQVMIDEQREWNIM